jgi:serine/threonine-protein kinase RsbT
MKPDPNRHGIPVVTGHHASVTIAEQNDAIRARRAGRALAQSLGFSTVDQTRLATAISELARNALQHAWGGVCEIRAEDGDGYNTIRVVVSDEGPGIADIALALQPGFSSGGGLGQGLPAVRRLMDGIDIESRPGRTVIRTFMRRRT